MENHLSRANYFYNKNNFLACIEECDKALNSGNKNSWVYARKGMALFSLGELLAAEPFLEKAINKGNKHFNILYTYAQCLSTRDMENSFEFYKRALEVNRKIIFNNWNLKSDIQLKAMLDKRLYMIYKKNDKKYRSLKNMLIKSDMNNYMKKKGFLVPEVYGTFKVGEEVFLRNYPRKIVIKPVDGFNSNGVFVIEDGVDLFRRIKLPDSIGDFLKNKLGETYTNKEMIVEELINDIDLESDPYLKIPRDFKVFTAEGRAYWVNVYNRNARGKLRSMTSYDTDWKRIPQMTNSYLSGVTEDKPKFFDEMIQIAETLSKQYPLFLRLDFYLSNKGPVFGEFTPFPGDFINATEFGVRTMNQMAMVYTDE